MLVYKAPFTNSLEEVSCRVAYIAGCIPQPQAAKLQKAIPALLLPPGFGFIAGWREGAVLFQLNQFSASWMHAARPKPSPGAGACIVRLQAKPFRSRHASTWQRSQRNIIHASLTVSCSCHPHMQGPRKPSDLAQNTRKHQYGEYRSAIEGMHYLQA